MIEKIPQTFKKLRKTLARWKAVLSNRFQEQSTTAQPLDKIVVKSAGDNVEVAVGVNKIPGKRCPIFCCRINPSLHSLRPEHLFGSHCPKFFD